MRRFGKLAALLAVGVAVLAVGVQPASANIGPRAWDRSTVVIMTMKAGTGAETTYLHDRIDYFRAVMSSNMSIVEGSCQANMPCIQVYWDLYGNTGWDGLTTEAPTGCLSSNAWCRYDATNRYATIVQFDRSYVDSFTAAQLQSVTCHELGRSLAEMTAASGATCMQDANLLYIKMTATEEAQARNKYAGVPR